MLVYVCCYIVHECTVEYINRQVASVCVIAYIYVCMYVHAYQPKSDTCLMPYTWKCPVECSIFLLFEFKHCQCGLLRPVSCTDRAILYGNGGCLALHYTMFCRSCNLIIVCYSSKHGEYNAVKPGSQYDAGATSVTSIMSITGKTTFFNSQVYILDVKIFDNLIWLDDDNVMLE